MTETSSFSLPRSIAVGALFVEGGGLALLAGFYLVEFARGRGENPTQVFASAVLILVFAALLAVVARFIGRGQTWARVAAGVWQVLLLSLGLTLLQFGQPLIGALLVLLAVTTVVATVLDARASRSWRQ